MSSLRQIDANRQNAAKSTGPKTNEGKRQSRRNAVRHGLTAETVVDALEDPADYKAFEASVAAGYDPQTAVERELVLRLASLLWRLRRATAIETGLFQIQISGELGERSPVIRSRSNMASTQWFKPGSWSLLSDLMANGTAITGKIIGSNTGTPPVIVRKALSSSPSSNSIFPGASCSWQNSTMEASSD